MSSRNLKTLLSFPSLNLGIPPPYYKVYVLSK